MGIPHDGQDLSGQTCFDCAAVEGPLSRRPTASCASGWRSRDMAESMAESITESSGATRRPPTHAQTNRPYLQTRSRRPRTTTRCEYGDRENARTIRARSEPPRTARIGGVILLSPAPPAATLGDGCSKQGTVAG